MHELNIPQQFANIYNRSRQLTRFSPVSQTTCNMFTTAPIIIIRTIITNFGNNQLRLNLAATLETTLGQLHDLRAMVFGEPARGLGHSDTSYASFVGAPSGMDLSTMNALINSGLLRF